MPRLASPFAAATLLLYGLSLTSGIVHRAVVEHAVCAEHGDVVHVTANQSLAHAARAATPTPATPGITASSPAARHGHDEHCDDVLLERSRTLTTARVEHPRPPPATRDRSPVVATPSLPAPYRLAPKTSPPV